MTKQQVKKAVKNQMTAEQMIEQIVQNRKDQLERGCFGDLCDLTKVVRLGIYRDQLEAMKPSTLIDWWVSEFSCSIV